jgi:FemAB-related protein (PEP-CTERM system-associated)
MKTIFASTPKEAGLWQEFVDSHAESGSYHCWGWKQVIQNSFGWPTYYLMLSEGEKIEGVLPLVWQKSWLFGNFLTSVPYLNGGGVLARSRAGEEALVEEAIALARRLGTNHLELRHRRDHALGLPEKTNKVAVVRPIDPDPDKMWQSLDHKVRTDIRKSKKSNLTVQFGGTDLLNEFYPILAVNMRDLGTPVYSCIFFREILRAFPETARICIVRHEGKPIAASFLTAYRHLLEAVWSCSLAEYRSMKPNMFLYWEILCFASKTRYGIFDFGRSSIGSGTHRFKLQWGSQEVPLHWHYWVRNGNDLPELNPQNPRYRAAIWLWQRLPLPMTKLIGPRLARCLP